MTFLLLCGQWLSAQESKTDFKKNHVSLNLVGNGIGISVQYARTLMVKENGFLNLGVGIGAVPFSGGISVPHFVSYNLGKNGNYLELGIGGTYWTGKDNATAENDQLSGYHLYPIIGYQRLSNKHFNFRIYANPFVHLSGEYLYENWSVTPFLGIGFGYSF